MTKEELLYKWQSPQPVLDHGHVQLIDVRRFLRLVDVRGADECWPWLGGKGAQGHGRFWLNGAMRVAPRVAFMLTYGPISPGLMVLHRCDNPPCCNPQHLREGTAAENIREMYDRNPRARLGRVSGASHPNTKLTDGMIFAASAAIAAGSSYRKEAAKFGVSSSAVHRAVTIWRRRHGS